MSEIKLNIFAKGEKEKPVKTLKADGYELMLGTIEDFLQVIDVDKLNDNMAVARMVLEGFGQIKPLLKDVFPELTDEDFKGIKVTDLVQTIMQMGMAVIECLTELKSEKN